MRKLGCLLLKWKSNSIYKYQLYTKILSLSTIKKEIENKKKFIFDLERTNPRVRKTCLIY